MTVLDKPKAARAASRELSPRAKERLAQERQFKRMLSRIDSRDSVFEIRLAKGEKPMTVRQRLMKVATDEGREIVVRRSERGWLVGLATPDRRSRRGRRRASAD